MSLEILPPRGCKFQSVSFISSILMWLSYVEFRLEIMSLFINSVAVQSV